MNTQTLTCNCTTCQTNAKALGRETLTIKWTPKNDTYAAAWADKTHVLVYLAFDPATGAAHRRNLNIELA